MTDKGYDSQANRDAARARDITPVIPRRENSKQRGRFFPKRLYKLRARIEQTIGKLKRFKRVAMRCGLRENRYQLFSYSQLCLWSIASQIRPHGLAGTRTHRADPIHAVVARITAAEATLSCGLQ